MIHFQDLDRNWVTQGWWRLDPGQEVVAPAYSPSPVYYFFAQGSGLTWAGRDSNAMDLEIVAGPFIHITGPIQGLQRRVVKAFQKEYSNGYTEHPMRFTCTK